MIACTPRGNPGVSRREARSCRQRHIAAFLPCRTAQTASRIGGRLFRTVPEGQPRERPPGRRDTAHSLARPGLSGTIRAYSPSVYRRERDARAGRGNGAVGRSGIRSAGCDGTVAGADGVVGEAAVRTRFQGEEASPPAASPQASHRNAPYEHQRGRGLT